jgi:hypothetical protein
MKRTEIKEVIVPEQYRYVIERTYFERTRTVSNLKFMLNKHLYDENPTEFINSDLFERLLNRCIEAYMDNISSHYGLLTILGIENKDDANIRYDRDEDCYRITWTREIVNE